MSESNKTGSKASPRRNYTIVRVVAFLIGLPGLVVGALMILSAFGADFLRLAVSRQMAFLAGLAIFLVASLFSGTAVGIIRGRGFNAIFGLAGLLFLFLFHHAVIYGSSRGLSVGFVTIPVDVPVLGYLVLAAIDGLLAYWLLYATLASRLPAWAVARAPETSKGRVQLIGLAIFFLAVLIGADLLGLFGNRR